MHYCAPCAHLRNFQPAAKLIANCGFAEKRTVEMAWTEDRVKLLVKLREEGKTSSQIAEALGDTTRNAVIGKIFRLGLAKPMKRKPAQDAAGDQSSQQGDSPEKTAGTTADADMGAPPGSSDVGETIESSEPDVVRSVEDVAHVAGMDETMTLVKRAERNAKKLSLLELTERTCKWPVGDPSSGEFWFCGLPSKAGKPYCEAHIGLAFQPFTSRRDNRSNVSKN